MKYSREKKWRKILQIAAAAAAAESGVLAYEFIRYLLAVLQEKYTELKYRNGDLPQKKKTISHAVYKKKKTSWT